MKNVPVLMVIASVLAGLGIVQMTFLLGQGVYRTVTWSREAADLRRDVQKLQDDLRVLEAVRNRATTPEYREQLARCQGFVGEGEKIVLDERATVPEDGNCEDVPLP